jgi:replication initiation protein RepC
MTDERAAPASPELEDHAISPRFILKVSPALKPYIVSAKPTWAHIVDAADWVRGDLGISRHAWIEACTTMGRYNAAAAIAVIAAKSAEIRSAGGYLRAMTERAREGTLHLDKSFYGLAEKQRQRLT